MPSPSTVTPEILPGRTLMCRKMTSLAPDRPMGYPWMTIPLPGAVCPATVTYRPHSVFRLSLDVSVMTPATSKTMILGPLIDRRACRSVPGSVESSRLVTLTTLPPRPPRAKRLESVVSFQSPQSYRTLDLPVAFSAGEGQLSKTKHPDTTNVNLAPGHNVDAPIVGIKIVEI